jgi:hypothetical protein
MSVVMSAEQDLERVTRERDDWQRLATEAVRILVQHPEMFAELRHVMDDLDLMAGSGPPPAV